MSEKCETLLKVNDGSLREVASVMARVDGGDESECLTDLLLSIKGTISDQCEVIKKFNRLSAQYRDNV